MTRLRIKALKRRYLTLGIAALAAMAVAGGAYAAWLILGNGSGGGRAGTAQPLTVVQVDPTAGLLYPGGAGDVAFKVTNPNGFPVTVTGATFSGVTSTDCDASSVSVDPSATLSQAIASGASATVEVPNVLHATSALPDSCQGAAFQVGVALTAQSGS